MISEEKAKSIKENLQIIKNINIYNKINKIFRFKQNYNSIIPFHIYQTWHTKNLPKKMQENIDNLKKQHYKFIFHLYDDEDCREFIKNNFDITVLNTYDKLKPGAYKADLWRYCILYMNGGIYLDIKFKCINNFRFLSLTEKEYFVRDREFAGGTYNGLMCCLSKNIILLNCINQIVKNVTNNYYGDTPLDVTGPNLLGNYSSNTEKQNMELFFYSTDIPKYDKKFIVFNNILILTYYDEYEEERLIFQKNDHYNKLWNNKDIYN